MQKGVLYLKDKLIQDNYYPTLIVGIGRGGSIVGALISGTLGNVPILVIDRVYEWTAHQRKEGLFEEIKIPKNVKEKYSNIPWDEMYRMRNKAIHEYFGVDLLF